MNISPAIIGHFLAAKRNTVPSGYKLGYNARNVTTQVDGTTVSTWTDLSGNGWDATAGTAPTLQKTATGYPALQFNGTSTVLNVLAAGALSAFANVGAITCVATVISNSASSGPVAQITTNSTTSTSRYSLQYPLGGTTAGTITMRCRRLDADGGQNITTGLIGNGFRNVIVGVTDFANALSTIYVNGVLKVGPTADLLTAGNTTNSSAGKIFIGTDGGGVNFLSGFVENVYVYTRALNSFEAYQAYAALI